MSQNTPRLPRAWPEGLYQRGTCGEWPSGRAPREAPWKGMAWGHPKVQRRRAPLLSNRYALPELIETVMVSLLASWRDSSRSITSASPPALA
jgi:hypothetical protein